MKHPWDDLRAPASNILILGQAGEPDIDSDGTFLFDTTTVEQCAIIFQMPHIWDSSNIRPHIHWSKTTDAAGDVEWEIRYRLFNNNSIPPDWTAWAAATGRSQAIGSDQTAIVDSWDEIDMSGLRKSCLISLQLRRNTNATDDNYGADARMWEFDIHYRRYGLGSQDEYPTT